MPEPPVVNQTILGVFPCPADRDALREILVPAKWNARFTDSLQAARAELRAFPFGVILTEARFPDGRSWEDLLRLLQLTPGAPPLIVADRLADERLWVEVLNLGAYDLLAKPFRASEVLHVLRTACLRNEFETRQAIPRKSSPATARSLLRAAAAGAAGLD